MTTQETQETRQVHFYEVGENFEKHSLQKHGPACLDIIKSEEFRPGDLFVLDMSETENLSHHGLAAMIRFRHEVLKKNGQIGLIRSDRVIQTTDVTKLSLLFHLFDSRDHAIDHLN